MPPQSQLSSPATAAPWFWLQCVYNLTELQRIERARIAKAAGLNPQDFSQPMGVQETTEPAPAAAMAVAAPPPVTPDIVTPAPVITPATPPTSPPASAPSPSPPEMRKAPYLLHWSVDPKTGKLVTSLRQNSAPNTST